MDATQTRKARKAVNEELHRLGLTYHTGLPINAIEETLTTHGFDAPADGIYTGHSGTYSELVGHNTWLTMTWHCMDSGRYEVVAYVN